MAKKRLSIVVDQKGAKRAEQEQKKLGSTISGTIAKYSAMSVAVTAAAVTLKNIVSHTLETASVFEDLRTRLDNMYNSVLRGGQAFDTFNEKAAKTPFELKEVVEAGASLKAFGLDAEKTLDMATDLAAFMNTSLVDAASAFGRAFAGGAGAADIFRERGILNLIKMKTGINDFKNVTLEEFRQAMFKTFTDPSAGVAGATEKLAKNISGLESNLGDAFSRLSNEVGKKFAPTYKKALQSAIDMTNSFTLLFKDFEKDTITALANVVQAAKQMENIGELDVFIKSLRTLSKEVMQSGMTENVKRMVDQFSLLTKEEKENIKATESARDMFWAITDVIYRLEDAMADIVELPDYSNIDWDTQTIDIFSGKIIDLKTEIDKTYDSWLIKRNVNMAAAKQEADFISRYYEDQIKAMDIDPTIAIKPELDMIGSILPKIVFEQEEIPEIKITADTSQADAQIDNTVSSIEAKYRNLAGMVSGLIGNSMVAAFTRGESAARAFTDAFKRMLLSLATQSAIFGVINLFTGGLFSKITGGLTGFMGFGGARAEGGPVQANVPYLVGEKGPEMFIPKMAGDILPKAPGEIINNENIGGNTYNITFTGNVTDKRYVEDFIIPQIKKVVELGR